MDDTRKVPKVANISGLKQSTNGTGVPVQNLVEDDLQGRGLSGILDQVLLVLFAVAGIGISIYLTTVHYANAPLLCSVGGVVDCSAVTTSVYSVVPGTSIPITIPGMVWFAVSGALTILGWKMQSQGNPDVLRIAVWHLIWSALGLIGVLYLLFAEVVKLHKICEWCTVVHVLTFLTFLLVVLRVQWFSVPEDEQE